MEGESPTPFLDVAVEQAKKETSTPDTKMALKTVPLDGICIIIYFCTQVPGMAIHTNKEAWELTSLSIQRYRQTPRRK